MPPTNFADDPTISDEEILWRRISPDGIKIDPETGTQRFSSGEFRTAKMSVHIASLTSAQNIFAAYPGMCLAAFKAGIARAEKCIVVRDPLENDPSHALVCRENPDQRLTKTQARKIADQAALVEIDSHQ